MCLENALIPQSADEYYDKDTLKLHLETYQTEIEQVLEYLNEGLSIYPECAALHFDKGILLEYWMTDYDEALKEYELAVKYQPRNPYYHWLLGQTYFVVKSDGTKKDEHFKLAEELGYETFTKDRSLYHQEMRFKEKTKRIDPHTYTKPKTGLFG